MEMKVDTQRIKNERAKRAWSQEHLAEAAGLGLRTIHRIEKSGTASLESIKALAAVLDIGIEDLCVREPVFSEEVIVVTPAALWSMVAYAFLAAMGFGAMLLDIIYARLMVSGEASGRELIFVEVADSLLSLGLLAILAGMVSLIFTWSIRPVRNLVGAALGISLLLPLFLVPFVDVTQEASTGGAMLRVLFGFARTVPVFLGLWKLFGLRHQGLGVPLPG